jgi:UDP:flavonoid glycosyltransferase YjiC (YdhE family)
MVVVWYVSSHGFGHAARDIEVVNEIGRTAPDVRIVMRTSVPASFVEQAATVPIDLQHAETDTGVAQIDSLRIDEPATARRAAAFHADFDRGADAEAEVLRQLQATLVVADIPPLACAAADRAGIPSLVIGNFTWDWIYAAYPHFDAIAPGVVATIGAAYARTTRALRLPLHGGFETIGTAIQDVPLIARKSRRGREESRRMLGVGPDETVVLASFGGFGLRLDHHAIVRRTGIRLIVTEGEGPAASGSGNPIHLAPRTLAERRLRYEDLVAASDVVVSKPGYGIVSECIANDTSLLYAPRSRFAEQDVFEREMPALLRCRRVETEDLLAGRWRDPIDALLAQPRAPNPPPIDGAGAAARAILDRIQGAPFGSLHR